jgi:hypothetical protein
MLKRRSLLLHFGLGLGMAIAACGATAQSKATCTVRGTLPAGSHLEFRAPGSPDRKTATPGDSGQYSLELDPGRYEISWIQANGKKATSMAWISGPEVPLNVEAGAGAVNASGQEFDLLGDWRITSRDGKSVGPAQVVLEAELVGASKTEKLSVWMLVGSGDEEKETDGALVTTPDGRILFRVRESRLQPDRVAALRVSVQAPGWEGISRRITPVLEFSANGHLHAIYPDDLTIVLENPSANPNGKK